MSIVPPIYVLDANVFIQAHRQYYAFDLCPGFWDCVLHHHQTGQIVSIDRVREEILAGGDALEKWVRQDVPKSFFVQSTSNTAVVSSFSKMMRWVSDEGQFQTEAVDEFAKVADGWLAAYAGSAGATLVTHEEYRPNARKRVPLPNVCKEFGVPYTNTFSMLRELKARFAFA